ncbi:hypothetical protein ACIQLJ_09495 [Microbacterium sp. NPDC091313]
MIRTTAVPRSVRTGVALVGVAGMMALAGCAGTAADAEQAPATTSGTGSSSGSSGSGSSAYTDGTYSAEGSYTTPETTETIDVTVTLAGGTITDVEVTGDPQAPQSQQYQSRFIGGISGEVVGKSIDEISVSRVAGSSLTSGGFNEAIEKIKAEAAA